MENNNASTSNSVASRAARRRRIEMRRSKMGNLGMNDHEVRLMLEQFVRSEYAKKRRNKHNHHAAFATQNNSYNNNNNNNNTLTVHGGGAQSSYYVDPSLLLYLNYPKYGMASVFGRRRDMEDAVAIQPRFTREGLSSPFKLQFYAVYDGHGCAHVAMKCKERLHEIVKEEIETSTKWNQALVRSFIRMDEEVTVFDKSAAGAICRCVQTRNDGAAAGTTAVVAILTPDKIIVANVGDSRAVLSRSGQAIPLSYDHKPERPDERERIEAAGGRVIYWDGARVMGVLATSRAIGDNYLKPFVSCEPEITITERTPEDDCLILGSDGLWDLVSNETACGVAKMYTDTCNRADQEHTHEPYIIPRQPEENTDQGCYDTATVLAKLALSRKSEDNVSVLVIDLKKKI